MKAVERKRRSGQGRRAVPRKSTAESRRSHPGASRRTGGGGASSWRGGKGKESREAQAHCGRREHPAGWRCLSQGECGLLADNSPSELPPNFSHLNFVEQGPVSVGYVCPGNYADMQAPASSCAVLFPKDMIA
jgi:hypothetical protein